MTTIAHIPEPENRLRKGRLIVGISGATGIVYGIRLLEALREAGIESHLVVSKAAELTRSYETNLSSQNLRDLAAVSYPIGDVGAAIASGSFRTMGMIVAPCSVKTMSELANGITTNLLTRAGDVVLKERRRLVLLLRESPLTAIHIRNMLALTESGAIIAPPVPAFYSRPRTLDDMVKHTIGRVLDLFDIDSDFQRWGEESNGTPSAAVFCTQEDQGKGNHETHREPARVY
jgi:4-hydroxy-3-polyprenylbenzoate decarboxylase